MSTPYNNNQEQEINYGSPSVYLSSRGSRNYLPSNRTTSKAAVSNSNSSGLGSIFGKTKDTIWGKSVPMMNKDAGGFYDTSFWDASQWQKFGAKGGIIGDSGQLYNADGSAFDVSSIGGNLKGLGSTTEGGLGGLLSNESLQTAGNIAENVGKVFGMYQAADDIFGSGAKSRKAAEKRLDEGFKQNYAMNQMAMDKFKEDKQERFKELAGRRMQGATTDQHKKALQSYMEGGVQPGSQPSSEIGRASCRERVSSPV